MKEFNKRITVNIGGKEVERHKVCFGLRPDKNHKNILHGIGAVYEKNAKWSAYQSHKTRSPYQKRTAQTTRSFGLERSKEHAN